MISDAYSQGQLLLEIDLHNQHDGISLSCIPVPPFFSQNNRKGLELGDLVLELGTLTLTLNHP